MCCIRPGNLKGVGLRDPSALPVTNDDNRNYIFSPEEAEEGSTGRCFLSDARLWLPNRSTINRVTIHIALGRRVGIWGVGVYVLKCKCVSGT